MEDGEETDRVADYLVKIYVLVEGYYLAERRAPRERNERATDGEENEGDVNVQAESGAFGTRERFAKDCACWGWWMVSRCAGASADVPPT